MGEKNQNHLQGGKSLNRSISDRRIVRDFLDDLQFRKRASIETVDSYGRDISLLMDFIESEGIGGIELCESSKIEDFIRRCRDNGESRRTILRRVSGIRTFFDYLQQTGRIAQSPVAGIRLSSPPKSLPKVIPEEQMKKLLEMGKHGGKYQRRTGMLIELMYATGARISEAVSLRLENLLLDTDTPAILIREGKGGKPRISPLTKQTAENLSEYLDEVRPLILEGVPSPWVFPTRTGKPVARQTAWADIKQLGKLAGLAEKLHPHVLRHTCATHLLENGCDLRTVQLLLNHSDISSTEIYTHVLEERKRSVFQTAHPRAKNTGENSSGEKGKKDG